MTITLTPAKNNIALLDIAHPTIDKDFFAQFSETMHKLKLARTEIAGVIINVEAKTFPQRYDLNLLLSSEFPALSKQWARDLRDLEMLGKPVIAAVDGSVRGGGLEIILACHQRIGVTPQATVSFPEVKLGLFPAHGGLQRQARLVGLENTLTFLTTGKPLSFAKSGLFTAITNQSSLLETCKHAITQTADDPRQPWERDGFRWPQRNPESFAMTKIWMITPAMIYRKTTGHYPVFETLASCLYEGAQLAIDSAIANDQQRWQSLLKLPATKNCVRSLGIDKHTARARIRESKQHVRSVGIIGAGMMGSGIAAVSALAGMKVVLLDTDTEKISQAHDRINTLIARSVATPENTRLSELVTATDNPTAFATCDLVIEAVFEDRDLKKEILANLASALPPSTIIASNTSTLPITSLASYTKHPENFIGLHFFSPVEKMPLVEIIKGKQTDQRAIDLCQTYVARLQKTPILVNDGRGFYTSRVFMTYLVEGLTMLAEGYHPLFIERAGRNAGMPVPPLALTDELSLTLVQQIFSQTLADGASVSATAQQVIESMLAHDRQGKKTGQGFYDYTKSKKKMWTELPTLFPVKPALPQTDMAQRMLTIQAVEATRCFEEKVVSNALDANVGSILGWGFPPFLGGVLHYIEEFGIRNFVTNAERFANRYGERFTPPQLLREMAENRVKAFSQT